MCIYYETFYDIIVIPSATMDNSPMYTLKEYKTILRQKEEKLFQKLCDQNQLYREFTRNH